MAVRGPIKQVDMGPRIRHRTRSAPPPDVLREVDRAAARARDLWRGDRELHFEIDDDSGRVIVQVRDRDGDVLRAIAPSEALDVMAGKPLAPGPPA